MAVRIRLRRMGAKRQPFYRLVVADSRSAGNGKYIESLGYYNPITEPVQLQVDEEKALEWLKKGALPSETARRLLKSTGVLEKWEGKKSPSGVAAGAGASAEPEAPAEADAAAPEPGAESGAEAEA